VLGREVAADESFRLLPSACRQAVMGKLAAEVEVRVADLAVEDGVPVVGDDAGSLAVEQFVDVPGCGDSPTIP
jgi:hypothetical protein